MSIFVIGNDGFESASGFAVVLDFAPMARGLNVEFIYRLKYYSRKFTKHLNLAIKIFEDMTNFLFYVNMVLIEYIVLLNEEILQINATICI